MSMLLAGLSLLAVAHATYVTPVAVPNGCSNLPGYSSASGMAGPWVVTADQCVNTTTPNQACSMEGFGSVPVYFLQEGDTQVKKGFVRHPLYSQF